MHKNTLQKDLLYSTVDEVLAGKNVITHLLRVNPEFLLTQYKPFIDKADNIILPAGTRLNWKKTVPYDGIEYDVYTVQGNQRAYIAVDPRNVEEFFGPVATVESLTESGTLLDYYYYGPVFDYKDTLLQDEVSLATKAVSHEQAVNNFRWQLKRRFGVLCDIDRAAVVSSFENRVMEPRHDKCPECGRELNDAGECPTCVLGDIEETLHKLKK